jgi:hypothetical protein
MCRVSKICCSCSQDVLYRDICVKTVKEARVHQTLAQSTHLASKVRSFESCWDEPDLAMALRNMTSLCNLKLPNRFDMTRLDGCTFKLDSFECDFVCDSNGSFKKFLGSQPSLKSVKFPMYFDSTLEATCLPNLTRIHARISQFSRLIPGRPLNEVISNGIEYPIDLNFFALSTTPIQKLTIDYSSLPTPAHLLASFLPSLVHFTLSFQNDSTSFNHKWVCGLLLY